jgi:hypothetical protein
VSHWKKPDTDLNTVNLIPFYHVISQHNSIPPNYAVLFELGVDTCISGFILLFLAA